ncbi:MAG TPA: hypothetical protein VFO01_08365 [Trebonia sp.]|nr:hypothetical protein [Trebonia sp.]
MPQILDHFLQAAYGQVCLAGQDAALPADSDRVSAEVLADATAIVVCVAGEEPEDAVEVEVYHGAGEVPRLIFRQALSLPVAWAASLPVARADFRHSSVTRTRR